MISTDSKEIIQYIQNAEKRTPAKVYLKEKKPIKFPHCKVFGYVDKIIFGDWEVIKPILDANRDKIDDIVIENDCRYSAVPLLDFKNIPARIEPGAVIREKVTIGEKAVIMMGAILNIGAEVGAGSMIDMGAVLGGRAIVGENCHIGAGTVLAGVIEPSGAHPVIVEDDVVIGANAVVLEGIHVGKGAVVGAGAVVIEDVPPNSVVGGVPAKKLKDKDGKAIEKTALIDALRQL